MKKLLTVVALGLATSSFADYYQSSGGNEGAYQSQSNMGTQYGSQTQTASDQEIRKKIQDEIAPGWFSQGFPNVTFDVTNGLVILRGTVNTQEDKTRLEDKIRRIAGIRQLSNQIMAARTGESMERSNQTYGRSDTYSSDMNPSHGKPDAYSSDRANQSFDKADFDETKLQESAKKFPQDSAATYNDRILNARIRDKISNGWLRTDYETLILRTNNGFVILSGTVDKPEEIQQLRDKLRDIQGIRGVNTQLSVKNP